MIQTVAGYIFFECQLLWGLIHLWDRLLCWVKAFLEEKVFSQRPHGMHIPSRWLASMWSLIKVTNPSLPHTLQINDVACLGVPFACLPLGIIFWPFSIIDLTFTPSARRSAPKVCFHLYLQKNSKMTIIIIIQLPFKNFRLHNQESRLWCRQGSHLSVERVPAASWLGTRFQVSHGYFMKYYMMGLLQMPNIMSSIEADRLICWKLDILSH